MTSMPVFVRCWMGTGIVVRDDSELTGDMLRLLSSPT